MSEVIVIESEAFNKLRDIMIEEIEKRYKTKDTSKNWITMEEAKARLRKGATFISDLRAKRKIIAAPQTGGRNALILEKSIYDYLEKVSKKG